MEIHAVGPKHFTPTSPTKNQTLSAPIKNQTPTTRTMEDSYNYNKEIDRVVVSVSADGEPVTQIPSEKEVSFLTAFYALVDRIFQ